MKMRLHYFYLLLLTNAAFCQVPHIEKGIHSKKKKLEMDYQKTVDLLKSYKEFLLNDKIPENKKVMIVTAISILASIAAVYEAHLAFNEILTPEKKNITSKDQEAINQYLGNHSYSKENETLMAHYFNCLLQE